MGPPRPEERLDEVSWAMAERAWSRKQEAKRQRLIAEGRTFGQTEEEEEYQGQRFIPQ